MRSLRPIAVVLLLLSGCGGESNLPAGPAEDDAPVAEEPEDMMSMEGIRLYLTDTHGQTGVARKPRVAVHAERFEALDNGSLGLHGVDGRIFDLAGEEALSFKSLGGRFDEAGRQAYLEGEVEARAGALLLHLQDLRWHQPALGKPGLAESEGPVLIEKEGLRLEAEGMKLHPDEGGFELYNVRGTVSLEVMTP